jgi:cephalosporin-C deacetylase-like acetyl esterase
LTGQRYHDRPMREWFVSELPEALTESVHDVQMVLRYLSDRGDFDMEHVGVFGTGSGATIAVLAAAVEPQIRAVEAFQPWGAWPTWLAKSSLVPETERPNYLKPAFLASVAPLDPVQWFGRVQTKALRVRFVLDNPVTPASAVQPMKAAIPSSAQVLVYPTERQRYQSLSGGRAFDWIREQLRPRDSHKESAQANDNERKAPNERPR